MTDKPSAAEAIFMAALEIETIAERSAFVTESCGTDVQLLARVQALLAAHDQSDSFLNKPPTGLEATILPSSFGDSLVASLDAGLAPAFKEDAAVVIGDANHSVLKVLGNTLDEIPHVSLRESEAEGADPIARPNSPEVPQSDSDSRYRWDGEIARGGMGAIIKGRDTDLGRDLAIKVLLDSHKDKPEVIQRFIEEAQIGGQLQHPGIAPVYELGQFSDKRPFFAMKLVKGETLARLLDDREDVTDERVKFIGIFEQMCQTMAYAHSRGVIHRDLKPANIMVGAFGEVQVMDWGLAKVLPKGGVADEKKSQRTQQGQSIIQTMRSNGGDVPGSIGSTGSDTQMGSVMGTPAYMPPEQALGEIDQMNERADVFGLGAILCEILTGKPPYVAEDGTRVFRMASRGKLNEALSRLDACGADENLVALTKHCLELEPVDRPRDAGVLAERVTGYLESVEEKLREAEVQRAAEAARADAEAAQAAAERERAEAQSAKAQAESARAEAESARAGEESKRRRTSVALAASVLLLVGLGSGGWLYIERENSIRQTAEADKQRQHAKEMDQQRQVAVDAQALAVTARQDAEQEREVAVEAKSIAEAAEEEGRRVLYATDMQLAPLLWKDDDATVAELRSRLDAHDPTKNAALKGKADLRGFEWHFYKHLLDHSAKVFGGPDNPIIDGAITADGQLVTLNRRMQLQRWDLESQLPAGATLELGSDNRDGPSVLSPNGKLVAMMTASGIEVVETTHGSTAFKIDSASDRRNLIFSPDGKILATVDQRIRWWDTADGQLAASAAVPESVWDRESHPVLSLSTDGRTFAIGAYGGADRIGNVYSVYQLDEDSQVASQKEFRFQGSIGSLALSADGGLIAISSTFGGPLIFCNALTGEQTSVQNSAHPSPISALLFSASGSQLVTAAQDGMCKLWSDEAFEKQRQTLKGHRAAVNLLALSPDETKLVSISSDQTARVWDVATGVPFARELAQTTEQDVAFSADGLWVATAEGNRVILRDTETGQPLKSLVSEGDFITSLALSRDGRLLACGHYPGEQEYHSRSRVTLWEIDTGRRLAQFAGENLRHNAYQVLDTLAFSPDGRFLVAGFGHRDSHFVDSPRFPVKCWEIATARPHLLFGHQNACVSIRFSADGETMATASHDGTVRLWSTHDWQPQGDPLDCGDCSVNCAAFSLDGQMLAAGDTNGTITLWNTQTGAAVRTLSGHANHVNSLAFSPDGRTLASGSLDQTVRLWNTATWRELMRLDYQGGALGNVDSLAFSADGRMLLTNGNHVLLWSTRPAIWTDVERVATRLEVMLDGNVDFATRIRMFSGYPSLQEALVELQGRRPDDLQVKAALETLALAPPEVETRGATEQVPIDTSERALVSDGNIEEDYWRTAISGRAELYSSNAEFSTALLMDGFTYLAVPQVPFDEYETFTIEAWVMDWSGSLLQQGAPGEPENSVFIKPGFHSGWESNGGDNFTCLLDDLPAGRWNHVAMVFDGKTQRLFLNGQVQHKRDAPKPGELVNSRTMYIGAQTTAEGPVSSGEGCLAVFRISRSAKYSEPFVPDRDLQATDDTVVLYVANQDKEGDSLRNVAGDERDAEIVGLPRWLDLVPIVPGRPHQSE